MSASNFRFACPSCHRPYDVPRENAGRHFDCTCGVRLQIPQPSPPSLGPPPLPEGFFDNVYPSKHPSNVLNPSPTPQGVEAKMILGIAGSVMLSVGLFSPVLQHPFIGVTFLSFCTLTGTEGIPAASLWTISGWIALLAMVVTVILAFVFTLSRLYKLLPIAGLLSAAAVIVTCFRAAIWFGAESRRNPLGFAITQFGWGWSLLIIGTIVLWMPLFVRKRRST